MKLPESMSESVFLAAGGVHYEGPTSLVQFTVEGTRMVSRNSKHLTMEINLKRMFQYHLAATYLPTILLMIITEIALFVDEKHFEVLVMLHLTTMLVMYTLYQGLQNIMPKVAYLKFIFGGLLLFSVIENTKIMFRFHLLYPAFLPALLPSTLPAVTHPALRQHPPTPQK